MDRHLSHRLMRIDSRYRTNDNDPSSDIKVNFNGIPSSHSVNIGLINFTMLNLITNINNNNNRLFLGRDFIDLTSKSIEDRTFGYEYTLAGNATIFKDTITLNTTNTTLEARRLEIETALTANIPNTTATLVIEPNGRLSGSFSNNTQFRFTNTNTSRFLQLFLGFDLAQTNNPVNLSNTFTLSSVFGRQEIILTKGQYTASAYMAILTAEVQAILTAEGNGSTMTFSLTPDEKVQVAFSGETFAFLTDIDDNPIGVALGFTDVSQGFVGVSPYIGASKVDFSGIKEIYFHCGQVSPNSCIVLNSKAVQPIHCVIPVDVAFGEILHYQPNSRHFWKSNLPNNFKNLSTLQIQLKDRDEGILDLGGAEWIAVFDLDVSGI